MIENLCNGLRKDFIIITLMLSSLQFIRTIAADDKRRAGEERRASKRLSNILLSDKIMDDGFCKTILPKLIEQFATIIEENSRKYIKELESNIPA